MCGDDEAAKGDRLSVYVFATATIIRKRRGTKTPCSGQIRGCEDTTMIEGSDESVLPRGVAPKAEMTSEGGDDEQRTTTGIRQLVAHGASSLCVWATHPSSEHSAGYFRWNAETSITKKKKNYATAAPTFQFMPISFRLAPVAPA